MPTPKTEQEYELMLAEQLPDKVIYDEEFDRFHWRGKGTRPDLVIWAEIRKTEWLEICRLIEEKMSDKQKRKYAHALTKVAFSGWSEHPTDLQKLELAWTGYYDMIHASWLNRAKAMDAAGIFKEKL